MYTHIYAHIQNIFILTYIDYYIHILYMYMLYLMSTKQKKNNNPTFFKWRKIWTDTLQENIEITYKKEIKLDDTINCKYVLKDNKHTVVIFSEDEKTIHAIINLY